MKCIAEITEQGDENRLLQTRFLSYSQHKLPIQAVRGIHIWEYNLTGIKRIFIYLTLVSISRPDFSTQGHIYPNE